MSLIRSKAANPPGCLLFARPRWWELLCLICFLVIPGCTFGLNYEYDESGLERAELPVQGDPERTLSYLIRRNPGEPRIIFIHGSPGHSSMYGTYLRNPIEGAEIIAVDRLGYGESRPHRAVVSFEEQASAIAPLLEQRNNLWPIVVGHSLGGPIAVRLAADNPGKVSGLILIGAGLNPELEEVRWYNRLARNPVLTPFLAEHIKISNEEMFACREQVEELAELLDQVACPLIIIHGTDDDLVPYKAVSFSIESFAENPYLYIVTLIGEGHHITKQRQEEVREAADELLKGLVDLLEDRP